MSTPTHVSIANADQEQDFIIQPSYKVTSKGEVPAEDSRTIVTTRGAVMGFAFFNEWNNTAEITKIVAGGMHDTSTVPCESIDVFDKVITDNFR